MKRKACIASDGSSDEEMTDTKESKDASSSDDNETPRSPLSSPGALKKKSKIRNILKQDLPSQLYGDLHMSWNISLFLKLFLTFIFAHELQAGIS